MDALELSILLIGTGRLPELDDAAAFLAARGLTVPIRIVTFMPFLDASGQVLLARDVEDHEPDPDEETPTQPSRAKPTSKETTGVAHEAGVLGPVDAAIEVAHRPGRRVKPWPKSITIMPPSGLGRTLLYVAPGAEGVVWFGYHLDNFAELYNADQPTVEAALGANWRGLTPGETEAVLVGFRRS